MMPGVIDSQSGSPPVVPGYPLNDDGTIAALFGFGFAPATAPAYNQIVYTYAGDGEIAGNNAVTTPAAPFAAPALIAMPAGNRACGLTIPSLYTAGDIRPFGMQFNVFDSTVTTVFQARVTKDAGDTGIGMVELLAGAPGSLTVYGTASEVALAGTKIALRMLSSGSVAAAYLYVNGDQVASTATYTVAGGFFASTFIGDENGYASGEQITIEIVPLAAGLADGYGAFPAGTLDMVGDEV